MTNYENHRFSFINKKFLQLIAEREFSGSKLLNALIYFSNKQELANPLRLLNDVENLNDWLAACLNALNRQRLLWHIEMVS